ncbi:anti-sigma factor family protein [Chondrinema litorale]|uniref:anti-sigma factor family protein n=1 Tax=Chondrinema litorale TaxID=2994555 RepID=UPI002542CF8B|nr:hypothetical protein [Chondrinema litorale]UZR95556.1 hypothetical protein OQ292_06980 [Chondrinema litorale]
MNSNIDKSTIIDYLYGEMNEDEKLQFEQQFDKDPALKAEVNAMLETRNFLNKASVQEPTEPLILNVLSSFNNQSKDAFWRKWASVAAALLVILVAAAWWNLEIEMGDGELRISFNKNYNKVQQAEIKKQKDALEEEIAKQKDLMNRALKERVAQLEDSLYLGYTNIKSEFQELVSQQNVQVQNQQRLYLTPEEVEKLMWKINEENFKNTTLLISKTSEGQQKYNEELIREFAEFVEEKRKSDLQLVSYALNKLKTDTQAQQEETNIILAKLINEWNKESETKNFNKK